VLVTGATGFIGRHLVAQLARHGVEVEPVGLQNADLCERGQTRRLLDATRPEVVINLARPTHAADQADGHARHAQIAGNVLATAREAGVRRLIHLGSSTEYGPAQSPVDEDAELRPTTPYGEAKARASAIVLDADREGFRTVVLRPFSVYGPGDLRRHLVPAAIDAAISGAALPLTPPGVERDWIYVGDVAEACALAIAGGADGQAVNLATGETVPNERVVERVAEATGRKIAAEPGALNARPWDVGVAGSTERARRLLGWRAGTSLEKGIRLTVASRAAGGRSPSASGVAR
jgi:UDP-glucose 4-epimerase